CDMLRQLNARLCDQTRLLWLVTVVETSTNVSCGLTMHVYESSPSHDALLVHAPSADSSQCVLREGYHTGWSMRQCLRHPQAAHVPGERPDAAEHASLRPRSRGVNWMRSLIAATGRAGTQRTAVGSPPLRYRTCSERLAGGSA